MLIPALHCDPAVVPTLLPDSHVIKLISESLQLISTALPHVLSQHELASVQPLLLASTHENHPYSRWARLTRDNAMWLVRLGWAMCQEKQRRWPDNRPHQYEPLFAALLRSLPVDMQALPAVLPENQLPITATSATSVPDERQRNLIVGTAASGARVRAFHLYYHFTKRHLWRFGGAAETRARKHARSRPTTTASVHHFVPPLWASFVLSVDEQRLIETK